MAGEFAMNVVQAAALLSFWRSRIPPHHTDPCAGMATHTRFTLAALQTQVQVARVFVDRCCALIEHDQLDTETASMAKYWTTDLQCQVIDECVQLHGGYGYMWEYPIARAWADARVQRIYGGTNEIMKEVIARGMGLPAH